MMEKVETLIPALQNVQSYHKPFADIHNMLIAVCSQKEKEVQSLETEVAQFICSSEAIISEFVAHVQDLAINGFSRQNRQKHSQHSQQKITKNKIKNQQIEYNKNLEKTKKTNIRTLSSKISNSVEANQIKQLTPPIKDQLVKLINKDKLSLKHCHIWKQASNELIKNPNICQLQLRNLYYSKNAFNYRCFVRDLCFYVCQECESWMKTSKIALTIRMHYKNIHNKKCLEAIQYKTLTFKQIYEKLKNEVIEQQRVFYKCNCKSQLFNTQKEYIEHIFNVHHSNPPPYSSHIFKQEKLIVNPSFNQFCVLEELLIQQLYYCGDCDFMFLWCADIYLQHLSQFHQGKVKSSFSSHYLKNQVIQLGTQDIRIQRKFAPQNICLSKQSKKMKHSIKQNTNESVYTAQINKEMFSFVGEPFEQELKMVQIICNYKGLYVCSRCQTNFGSYQRIKQHLSKKNKLGQDFIQNHLFRQDNFIKIIIKKAWQAQSIYILPTNVDQETKQIKFNVPIYNRKIKKVEKYILMSYKQFIEYINNRDTKVRTFRWISQY